MIVRVGSSSGMMQAACCCESMQQGSEVEGMPQQAIPVALSSATRTKRAAKVRRVRSAEFTSSGCGHGYIHTLRPFSLCCRPPYCFIALQKEPMLDRNSFRISVAAAAVLHCLNSTVSLCMMTSTASVASPRLLTGTPHTGLRLHTSQYHAVLHRLFRV